MRQVMTFTHLFIHIWERGCPKCCALLFQCFKPGFLQFVPTMTNSKSHVFLALLCGLFLTTMEVNARKLNGVLKFCDVLCDWLCTAIHVLYYDLLDSTKEICAHTCLLCLLCSLMYQTSNQKTLSETIACFWHRCMHGNCPHNAYVMLHGPHAPSAPVSER